MMDDLIARVADHCFWLGRYLERAESMTRVLAVTRSLALDGDLAPEQYWPPVVIVSGEREAFLASHGPEATWDGEAVQAYLTWDETAVSIRSAVRAARENARAVRDVVSGETWETLNELWLWIESDTARREYNRSRDAFYRRVRDLVQLAIGLMRSTMLHDPPLDFIWLGLMLERAGQTARILDVHHHALTGTEATRPEQQVLETALWLALLRACSGFEPYMKRHRGRVGGKSIATFLSFELSFPRSIRYCVHSASDRLRHLRPSPELPGALCSARLAELVRWLDARADAGSALEALHDDLTHVVDEIHAACGEIGSELLGHGTVPEVPPAVAARAAKE